MGKKNTTIASLAEFAGPQRSRYIFSVVLAVIGEMSGILPYFAAARIISGLISFQADLRYCLVWCAIGAAGHIVKGVCCGISTAVSHKATFLCMKETRSKLVSKLSRVPMGRLLDTPSGYYKDVIVDRVEGMETTLAHLLPEMTANIIVPAMILIYIAVLDWRMMLITLITLPIGLIIMKSTMKGYGEKYAESVEISGRMTNSIVEYMGGIEVIKAFSQSARSYEKYSKAVKDNAAFFYNWMKGAQWPMSCYTAITPSVLLFILPAGCIFYAGGSLTAGNFITIMVLALGVIGPLITASNYVDNLARVSTVIGQIQDISETPELVRPDKDVRLNSFDIQFDKVSFSYHKGSQDNALSNVNLRIPAGKVTALVGPSGSGKSTVAKLTAGFWDADSGAVMLGEHNVKSIPLKQLSAQIAYVSQDNYLFDVSIRENIRMGRMGATDAEVEQAARNAGCEEFILALENGYDTVAGSAGGHLSGGERQRIAIARAMLKDAPVIILDEATAYIDPENEAVIQTAVANLISGKTLLVIAHRLSTITDADQIVVMDKGRISSVGTHSRLLEESELYKKMWQAHIGAKDGGKI